MEGIYTFIFLICSFWATGDVYYLMVESLLDRDRSEVFFWCGSVLVHGESKSRVASVIMGFGSGIGRSCVDVGGWGTRVVGGGGDGE